MSTPGVSMGYTVTTTSTPVLSNNPGRAYLLISNLGPQIVYMAIGTNNNATTLTGFPIPVGGNYEQDFLTAGVNNIFQGDFACITASGSSTVVAVDR